MTEMDTRTGTASYAQSLHPPFPAARRFLHRDETGIGDKRQGGHIGVALRLFDYSAGGAS